MGRSHLRGLYLNKFYPGLPEMVTRDFFVLWHIRLLAFGAVQSWYKPIKEGLTMNISYIRSGDHFIPDLKLPEENRPIGKWGRIHRDYLKDFYSPLIKPGVYVKPKGIQQMISRHLIRCRLIVYCLSSAYLLKPSSNTTKRSLYTFLVSQSLTQLALFPLAVFFHKKML